MSGVQRAGGQRVDFSQLEQAEATQQAPAQEASQATQGAPSKQQLASLRGRLFGPGMDVPVSGQYGTVDGSGKRVGKEKTLTAGEPFPPAARGLSYKLVDATKHGGTTGVGGATIGKPGQTAPRSGQYEWIDASGRGTDRAATMTKGTTLPPTPKGGGTWKLIDATGSKRSGETAEISGQYAVLDARGKATGDEVTVTKGEPFPPAPKGGQAFRLIDTTRHVFPEKAKGELRPGQTAKTSGQYELISPSGKKTGKEVTLQRGDTVPPPAGREGSGYMYKLKDITNK